MIDLSKVGIFQRELDHGTKTNEAMHFYVVTNRRLNRGTVIELENKQRLLIVDKYAIIGTDRYRSVVSILTHDLDISLDTTFINEFRLFQIV